MTTLPTTETIELMTAKDLILTYNAFASTAGQNPVKKFETREVGIKRLIKLADALRAKGVTEPSAPVDFPVLAKAPTSTPEVAQDGTSTEDATTTRLDVAKGPAPATVAAIAKKEGAAKKIVAELAGKKPTHTAMVGKKVEAPKVTKVVAPTVGGEKVTVAAQAKARGQAPLAVRLRELIQQTKPVLDNAEIWAIVQKEYELDDSKRGYVAGQRRAMAKAGA